MRRSLVFVLLCAAVTQAAEFWPDHDLAIRILSFGEPDFSEGVALELPAQQSQLRIRRIGLVLDGMRIRAAFRDKTRRVPASLQGGVRYLDAYYNEVAAYVVARQLNLNLVPPTVLRAIGISKSGLDPAARAREGSLQLWVEDSIVEYDLQSGDATYPGDAALKIQQLNEIYVFDCVIGNVDRHAGNILIDLHPRRLEPPGQNDATTLSGKLWAIDHSRAFHGSGRLDDGRCKLDRLSYRPVSLRFVEGLRTWDSARLKHALVAAGLSDKQIASLELSALEKRLRRVRERLEAMQRESGLDGSRYFSSGYWHDVQ